MDRGVNRQAGWVFLGLVLFVFFTYASFAPHGLSWLHLGTDGGDFITAAMTGGVPHPSGYAPYLVLSRLFALLPIGESIAHRFNLFSSMCMALSAGFLGATFFHLRNEPIWWGLYLGLAWAFTPLVVSQALITEVYALNCCLIACLIYQMVRFSQSSAPIGPWQHFGLGFLAGLAPFTHLTSALFLPWVAGVWLLKQREGSRFIQDGLMFAAGGVLPLLLVSSFFLQRGFGESPVVWGELTSISSVWWLITGELYRPNVFNRSIPETWTRLSEWFALFFTNWTWVGWLPGIFSAIYGSVRFPTFSGNAISFFIIFAFYLVYALFYGVSDAIVFFLPGLLALLVSIGFLKPHNERINPWYILLPICLLLLNYPRFSEDDSVAVRQNTVATLDSMPPDAIVLTNGQDRTTFSLWYYHYVENYRPDVVIIDQNLMAFDWYRARASRLYPEISGLDEDNLSRFIEENSQRTPVCRTSLAPSNVDCLYDD